jgi:hypothetical protein
MLIFLLLLQRVQLKADTFIAALMDNAARSAILNFTFRNKKNLPVLTSTSCQHSFSRINIYLFVGTTDDK